MARILVLISRVPYPPREGHQLRSWHLLRALAQAHEVTLLSFQRLDDVLEECAPLRGIVARMETFPIRGEHSRLAFAGDLLKSTFGLRPFIAEKYFSLALRARLIEEMKRTDLVHVDMLPLMRRVPESPVPVVLAAQTVEHLLLRQRAAQETTAAHRLFLRDQVPKLAVSASRRAA